MAEVSVASRLQESGAHALELDNVARHFGALVALTGISMRIAASERSSGVRVAGLAVGLAGVAVVVGVHPAGGWWGVVGTLAVVVASLAYAAGA